MRRWAPYADPAILPCVALLNGLGLVVIHRIDLAMEGTVFLDGSTWDPVAFKQVIWTGIGLLLFAATLKFLPDHRTLARFGYTFGLVGLVALLLPGVLPGFIAPTINGAKIWLRVGPLSIQPGEFAKILLMVFFAAFLVSKRDLFTTAGRRFLGMDLPRARDLGPLFAAWGVTVARHGAAEGPRLLAAVLRHRAGAALRRHRTRGLGRARSRPVRRRRDRSRGSSSRTCSSAWRTGRPDRHATTTIGGGYQIAQSLFGLATGGIGGAGLGAGRPEMIPEANTDFITAVIGEELGFVGFAALLLIYMVFAMRGLRSAISVRDSFGKLLGGGLAFAVCFQVFIVVGGVTKLIPMTGITAPFLSYGGSSLLANYILVALLLRISAAARAPQRAAKPKPQQPAIADQHTVMVERPK